MSKYFQIPTMAILELIETLSKTYFDMKKLILPNQLTFSQFIIIRSFNLKINNSNIK